MDLVVTLVAPTPLDPTRVVPIVAALGADRVEKLGAHAMDLYLSGDLAATRVTVDRLAVATGIDAIAQPVEGRSRRLLVSDMDSTLIGQECIDELAAVHGVKPRVAAITARAMRGEIDFAAALVERVALLEGISGASIDDLLRTVIVATPGAETLAATCRAHGIRTVIVSGGFIEFAEPVRERIGFDAAFANRLSFRNGTLDGTVMQPVLGADAKRLRLLAECAALGIGADAAVALGDGANDLAMIEAAGLGIAFRAKPAVAAAADGEIRVTDLTTVLYALGISETDFVVPLKNAETDREHEGDGRGEREKTGAARVN